VTYTESIKRKGCPGNSLSFFDSLNYNLLSLPLFLILSVLLGSCATVNQIPVAKNVHIIENVPFYQQETYQCGPASLAGVLNYWGTNIIPDDIAKEIYSDTAGGTLNIDMVLYAQSKGLNAIQYKGNMNDLKKNMESGYPVIVLVDYGISLYQANHFMVVVGYNEHGLIVNSGKDKGKFISAEDFLKAWKKTDYWTLLIKPR
jgi:predicted double-glycine peptidase